MKLITVLPGLGKSTTAKKHEDWLDLEDYVKELYPNSSKPYKSLRENKNLVRELLDSIVEEQPKVNFVTSSIWWEDFGLDSDLVIGMEPSDYNHHTLVSRGRPDLPELFDEETLHSWATDQHKVFAPTGRLLLLKSDETLSPLGVRAALWNRRYHEEG